MRASVILLTAVSNPTDLSVSATSLSIVLGIATKFQLPWYARLNFLPGFYCGRNDTRSFQTLIPHNRVYPEHFNSVHIRLVGYPGSAEVLHPQPLIITSTTGKIWKAKDIFLDEAPAPTVGQYDLKDILPELPFSHLLLNLWFK